MLKTFSTSSRTYTQDYAMQEVIARRSYLIDNDDSKRLEVLIFAPFEDQGDYRCRYQVIDSGEIVRNGYALGVDSLQALVLAIERAGVDVTVSDYAKNNRIFWNNQNSDLGLLLPNQSQS
jgi:hypothetical protein